MDRQRRILQSDTIVLLARWDVDESQSCGGTSTLIQGAVPKSVNKEFGVLTEGGTPIGLRLPKREVCKPHGIDKLEVTYT